MLMLLRGQDLKSELTALAQFAWCITLAKQEYAVKVLRLLVKLYSA